MSLGENIRHLRKKRNMSQDELAQKLGYKSFTTIQKWESEVSEPPFKKLKELAELFHVNIDELVDDDLNNDKEKYYLNEEAREIAQEMLDNPELKMLLSASRDVSPEDLKLVREMVLRMKKEEEPTSEEEVSQVPEYEDDYNQDPDYED